MLAVAGVIAVFSASIPHLGLTCIRDCETSCTLFAMAWIDMHFSTSCSSARDASRHLAIKRKQSRRERFSALTYMHTGTNVTQSNEEIPDLAV